MKYYFQWVLLFVALFLGSCSSSQLAFYKSTESDSPWKVTVVKSPISSTFICKINDTDVVEESFGLFRNSFEKSGEFRGKKVVMSGYEKSHKIYKSENETTTETSFQIKVFIDGEKVEEFVF